MAVSRLAAAARVLTIELCRGSSAGLGEADTLSWWRMFL